MPESLVAILSATAAAFGAGLGALAARLTRRSFDRDRQVIESSLRGSVFQVASHAHVADDADAGQPGDEDGPAKVAEPAVPLAAQQRIDDDRFAELLVQRYAYGLTQSQRSFFTSQVFSVLGGGVLLTGVGLAIWRAETSGDLYAAIVTTSAGIVTTFIGRLFHRESDKALKHMASETDALRDDMRAERSAEQAILLLEGVPDPKVKARLQAGLIMRFAGSELPSLSDGSAVPAPRDGSEVPQAAGQ
ncbi:hypothetical protein HRW18_11635 [Streptomyces lunaelactis]|uniref:TRADD-N-associated membrane domain-containing protein n=1 Tax=Streptomyces lunaelactis TaxID=1535768 RepID=UPI0015846A80|nr:hypothetical protein [Streptomyces lunaelactis]NUK08649.1 hypothetical protein [Streptomyces lunaelactis]NUL10740.1 hypothetical protein [Streptomyces lunaelactis]NUL22566.1 hypothetical protein [Streptomyces lunaelactis]